MLFWRWKCYKLEQRRGRHRFRKSQEFGHSNFLTKEPPTDQTELTTKLMKISISRQRWSSSLAIANIPFDSYKSYVESILSGEKGLITASMKAERSVLLKAKRYDLLIYLLCKHLNFMMNNDLVKEAKSLNQLEIVLYLQSLDYKQISKFIDTDLKKNLAKSLLFALAKLGDYKLLEKYISGVSQNLSDHDQRFCKLMCLSNSRDEAVGQDPMNWLGDEIQSREIPTVLKYYYVHAPQEYERNALDLKIRYPQEFTKNIHVITQLLAYYFEAKKIGNVKRLLVLIFEEKLEIDNVLLLCIVSGFFKNNLASEAVSFFTKFTQLGYDPGPKAYSAMIIGCSTHGKSTS